MRQVHRVIVKSSYTAIQSVPKASSNRARRKARKCFLKHKQLPAGYSLLYKMNSFIEAQPVPTKKLLAEWSFLDKIAVQTFNKKFDALSDKQKARLFDSLHKED